MLQVLRSDFGSSPWVLENISRVHNLTILDNWKDVNINFPVFCEGNLLHDSVRSWLNSNQLAVYFARGWLGNHPLKKRNFWRYSINGWANILARDIPYSRWGTINLPRHAWKVKKIKNVLIAPSKMTTGVWTPELNRTWANHMSNYFPGANIKIRQKLGKPGVRYDTLWNDLDWADLVVSQSSAITAEAFWYGKKVISTEPCITWLAGKTTLEEWEDPTEPAGRDQWHEHVAWSQFTVNEWTSGRAWELMELYIGDIKKYLPNHKYSFKF
jgi:hypothetical protein